MATNPALVAHLYRRAGFGATPAQLDDLSRRSWADLVDGLLAGLSGPDPAGDAVKLPHLTTVPESNVPGYHYNGWTEYTDLITWWLERMVVTGTPLREKLTLLLHCQFPTSWTKVGWANMMYVQNQLFRSLGPGNFETLVQAVAKDPVHAHLARRRSSHKDAPNQNFARELMERFTMGIGNYSQDDVVQAARCFTGWELDTQTGQFFFNCLRQRRRRQAFPRPLGPVQRRGHHKHRHPRARIPPLGHLAAVVVAGLPGDPERSDRQSSSSTATPRISTSPTCSPPCSTTRRSYRRPPSTAWSSSRSSCWWEL